MDTDKMKQDLCRKGELNNVQFTFHGHSYWSCKCSVWKIVSVSCRCLLHRLFFSLYVHISFFSHLLPSLAFPHLGAQEVPVSA